MRVELSIGAGAVGGLRSLLVAVVVGAVVLGGSAPATAEQRFELSFPASAHAEPVTGRIYVMISRNNDREPRLQIGRTGVPFFGRDVEQLAPGAAGVIDATDLGSPVTSLADIPAGDYYVQGFVNVYSEFVRADGHVVWMHDDQWEGQHWNRSPGNLHSDVELVRLDPDAGGVIALSASNVIPPIEVPPDTEWVRRFKVQSPMLTEFWGRPIYLGATVLLPRDYDSTTIGSFEPGTIARAVAEAGAERVVFGSNAPTAYPDLAVESIRRAGLPDGALELVLGDNLARIYKLG